jgi:hypothetical protein
MYFRNRQFKEKRPKELESQGGRFTSSKRPILKIYFKIPLQKFRCLLLQRSDSTPRVWRGLGLLSGPPPPPPSMVWHLQNQRWSDRAHCAKLCKQFCMVLHCWKNLQEPHYTKCTESPSMTPFLYFSAPLTTHINDK